MRQALLRCTSGRWTGVVPATNNTFVDASRNDPCPTLIFGFHNKQHIFRCKPEWPLPNVNLWLSPLTLTCDIDPREMDCLSSLTLEVDFVQAGELVFSATTWAGYLGVLTGVRGGGYSVSVNYRRSEAAGTSDAGMIKGVISNFLSRGFVGRHWPVSFLVCGP